jgi:two-component system LytT family response regulator
LDISLKEGDSFEILRRLDEISFDIIFVTAFDEYSIKALKYSGMACLFKPLDVDELQQAINNIVNRPTNMKMAYQMVDGMLKSKFTKIPVITSGGLIFADVRDITYIQKTSGGVEIHFRNNESVGSNRELMEFAEVILNKTFCSMGSEYLVNTAHVDIASTSKHKLVFYNAEILNVSENDNSKLMKFISK